MNSHDGTRRGLFYLCCSGQRCWAEFLAAHLKGLEVNRARLAHDLPNWQAFYRRLCRVGPSALKGLPREWIPILQSYARTGDLFWSDDLQAALFNCWDNPSEAVEQVVREFVWNVRQEFGQPPLCWSHPWSVSPVTGEPLPLADCVERIDAKLTARQRRSLVRAAQSRFVSKSDQRFVFIHMKEVQT